MHRSQFFGKQVFALAAAIIAATFGMAGPLEPPPGPVTSTGRFGPRTDVLTLPGNAGATRIISQPGSYYLSGNLTGEVGKVGILISTGRVNLDLNGFRLAGVPGSLDGIRATTESGFQVSNGIVDLWGGDGIEVSNLEHTEVHDVISKFNGGWGMNFANNTVTVDRCIATYNGAGGILAADYLLLTHTQVVGNTGDGVRLNSAGNIVDNIISGNTGTGISCNFDCLVRGNHAQFNTTDINAPFSTVIENHP